MRFITTTRTSHIEKPVPLTKNPQIQYNKGSRVRGVRGPSEKRYRFAIAIIVPGVLPTHIEPDIFPADFEPGMPFLKVIPLHWGY